MLGSLHLSARRLDESRRYLIESLDIFEQSGDRSGMLLIIAGMALVYNEAGSKERFFRLAGAAERLAEETGTGLLNAPVEFLDFALPEKPTDPEGIRIWAEGRQMSAEEAIAYLRSLQQEEASTT
jgi:hypothetical protein